MLYTSYHPDISIQSHPLRKGFQEQALSKSWHNQNWLDPDSQPRMATMLRLEKSKRIEFTPGRGTTRGQNALKWMGVYAKGSGTHNGINFHSFFRLWQLVLLMSYSNLLQGILNMCRKCSFSWLLSLNNAILFTGTAHCENSVGQCIVATTDKTPNNS